MPPGSRQAASPRSPGLAGGPPHPRGSRKDWDPSGGGGIAPSGGFCLQPKDGEPQPEAASLERAGRLESKGGCGFSLWARWAPSASGREGPFGAEAAETWTEEPGGLQSMGLQGAGLNRLSTHVLRRQPLQDMAGTDRRQSSRAFSRGKGLWRPECLLAGEPKHQADAPVS